ncbi:hypothetical protein OG594_24120 [Streptomyces sp. NBC_01214]|uniref:hypothetical protein n=1 Tax=Streptomyces sp. NBC_01214 TaxID=2903777 RepID=UPI00225B91B2|nr:hypothetical protein [Streptomyces sp. NBC_01214]MCX4804667.1 hypothetical protein [Streptomyces sp. NBC_01214]
MEKRDFWDRPEGDWGEGRPQERALLELREHAHSCYRLGSLALSKGDLEVAENWLWKAVEADQPGGWFRFAVTVHRRGPCVLGDDVLYPHLRYLVQAAAEFGHGDAHWMRPLLRDPSAVLAPFATWEDPDYGPELVTALRAGLDVLPLLDHNKEEETG